VVLVVDDDPDVRAAVRDVFLDEGFRVIEAATGCEARDLVTAEQPDVVLLDLGLPDVSGLDVLSEVARTTDVPVVVLTGRLGETDTVVGLDLGADDYVTKPFRGRELLARVNAVLRRSRRAGADTALRYGPLVIDEMAREVTLDDAPVELTPREFELLVFLARAPRQVFSREQLLERVWGSSSEWQDANTVAEHVYRLRRKLDPDDRARWIETVRGVGYRFAVRPS
jgi:DNA-binding response OmpR family regulator